MPRFQCVVGGIAFLVLLVPASAYAGKMRLILGTDQGAAAHTKAFDFPGPVESASFFPYGPAFTGGVRVAAGDVNDDGVDDIITGAGPGGSPHVKVFSGSNGAEIRSFFPFSQSFSGGVYVAAGDLNGDGNADLIAGAGSGAAPQVSAFDGVTLAPLRNFFAYTPSFMGGVRVAVGDVNDDGTLDIITAPGSGIASNVKVFDGITGGEIRSFNAFNPSYTGGVFVAAGDVNGDGADDIVAGTDTGSPAAVVTYSGPTLSAGPTFTPFGTFSGGVRVAAGDLTGDGRAEIVVGTGPGAGQALAFTIDGQTIANFQPYGPAFTGGVFVAAIPEPCAVGIVLLALGTVGFRRSISRRPHG